MSVVRDYLAETREREGEKGWLRREPRATHPEILALVREAVTTAGLFYDYDVNAYVNEKVADLAPHEGHPPRDPLVAQLGHEVYIARGALADEARRERIAALRGEGYRGLYECAVADGEHVTIRIGTVYVGSEVPDYGQAFEARAVVKDGQVEFAPKGTRVQRYLYAHVLVRKGWDA